MTLRLRLLLALLALASVATLPARATPRTDADVAAARRLFEANLDAIRRHDATAYLACYLESPALARVGPSGPSFGYDSLAASMARGGWPDWFEAHHLRLVPVADGVVYGTYRYRVRYGATEQAGLSERVFVEMPGGWTIAVSTAFPAPPGTDPPPRAIVGATLVDGNGKSPVRDAVVVIRDGRIVAAGPRGRVPVPADADTLDARGCWITPGLVDAHVHFSQTGWFDGRPDALDLRAAFPYESVAKRLREHPEVFQRSYLASGVTAVFDVGGFPWTVAMAHAAEQNLDSPRIAAAGPLLSTLDFWLNLPAERQFIFLRDSSAAVEGVRYLKSLGADAVKVWFIVPPDADLPAMERVVRVAGAEAKRAGLPLIVHATGLREAKAALRAGASLLVHAVSDQPLDEEFLKLAKANGTLYCPTITVLEGYHHGYLVAMDAEKIRIDDPNGVVDSLTTALMRSTVDRAEKRIERAITRRSRVDSLERTVGNSLLQARRAGIPIVMGTDAGNPFTLHGPAVYAEMEAMQRAGLTPMEVIVASTKNGARAMGRERDFGTVEPGKLADLLIVDADPTRDVANLRHVRWVVRGGETKSLAELRAAVALTRW